MRRHSTRAVRRSASTRTFSTNDSFPRLTGFSLWKLLIDIREEILIVVGTAFSESVLPRVMEKLERLGCAKSVVGLVIPTGYSFNLDGTSIYLTMAAGFVAQVSGVHLSFRAELSLLAILLLTSKGAAAMPGGGFITLAATLSAFPSIPIAGLALLLGVDRFMSEARAITNLIGNTVATLVVARWEGALDLARARTVLNSGWFGNSATLMTSCARRRLPRLWHLSTIGMSQNRFLKCRERLRQFATHG
jgi:aerobic C4-dicarboxylate transport protein